MGSWHTCCFCWAELQHFINLGPRWCILMHDQCWFKNSWCWCWMANSGSVFPINRRGFPRRSISLGELAWNTHVDRTRGVWCRSQRCTTPAHFPCYHFEGLWKLHCFMADFDVFCTLFVAMFVSAFQRNATINCDMECLGNVWWMQMMTQAWYRICMYNV